MKTSHATMGLLTLALATLATLATMSGGAAHAASTVEPRVRLLVRERPTVSSRIVDRVPPGHKLPLLGRTADGNWSHVETGKRDGWVPSSQLKGARAPKPEADESGDEEVARKPLAPRKNVRAEAWVSASRYHDGEDNKLTVSANKAELYGRPASGGAVLGVVRRGDVVQLVRKSADKKWLLVDIGGGESAWLASNAARAGVFRAAPTGAEAEEPAVSPVPQRRAVVAVRQEEAEPEAEPETPPPPPPSRKTKRVVAAAVRQVDRAVNSDDQTPPARTSAERDEEAPPLASAEAKNEKPVKKGKRRLVRLASRDNSVGFTAERSSSEPSESLSASPPGSSGGNNFIGVGVRAGVAILSQRFTSNGTGALTNYDMGTNALGVQVGAGYTRAVGRTFRVGLDASYAFAGAAAVRYRTTDGGQVALAVQNHTIDGGLNAGVHLNALGGMELRARLGFELALNLIQGTAKAPLPSDRVLGMTAGLGISAPNLLRLANRPFGVSLFAMVLAPASRAQTVGLEDGAASSSYGASFGGGLAYGLYKGLSAEAAYNYAFVLTHYSGPSRRNVTITSADRGSAQHLITVGLAYNY